MRNKILFPLLATLFFFSAFAQAQLWTGIIDPSRAVAWQPGIPGGVPSRTTVCATLNPGATASQISAAIAACPSGQVVYLNAGTYNLSSSIDFGGTSNVTLRGAGPTNTNLVFSAGSGCGGPIADVCVDGSFNWNGGPQHTASWTGGYSQGATQITLSTTAGLSVGQVLILDQDNDAADTGQVFVCDTTACSSEGGTPGRNCSSSGTVSGCTAGENLDRNQQEYKLVTAIDGNTVTISPGLYLPNWRSSQNPGVFWATALIRASGIENLTLDHSSSNEVSGTVFFNAYQCWMKNVRSIRGNRNHVWLQYSAGVVVRDSYFYGTLNAETLSYGVEPWQSADLLVENNVFQAVTTPILVGNTSGSVFAYNYDINNTYNVNPTWQMPGPTWAHDAGVGMNLIEGNAGTGFMEDAIHGTHNFSTVFRNQYSGLAPGQTLQTVPIILMSYSRYDNVIGNVLGTAGYHTHYQSNEPTAGSCNTSIYNLGWSGPVCANGAPVPQDPVVISTLMRWGNYDVANGAAQYNASEVPSGISSYSNPVPASHSLPSSFYLTAQPSWWGSVAWPPAGPDVSGGTGPGGHAYAIPSQNCYANGTFTNGIMNFDASNCYGSNGLNPPQNLKATVH
jgi:hypothetical protein